MIQKNNLGKPLEEEKKGSEITKSTKGKVYKKTGVVFRAQNYKADIDMDNLNTKNNDYFEIKKILSGLTYKPLNCLSD